MAIVDQLSDAEVDQLLERFDQTEPGLQRRIIAEFVAKLARTEDMLRHSREHAEQLDRNWNGFHEVAMGRIRTALGMPDASIPDMVRRIRELRGG
jgi:flagellar motor switch protein FliM